MKIKNKIIDFLNENINDNVFETGGCFGSSDGVTIDRVVLDICHNEFKKPYSYSPNVDYLNDKIKEWQNDNISFMGIFHTHLANANTLSVDDTEYIMQIMSAMPDVIEYLFFPIYVLPKKELICYRAVKYNDSIIIEFDETKVIN